jgi:hypothetical protein
MRRGTRFFIGLASAVITYASLTAFVGPRYHLGWQYNNYYRGYYHPWYPYRPYLQQPPYPPPDSFYNKPPQRNY